MKEQTDSISFADITELNDKSITSKPEKQGKVSKTRLIHKDKGISSKEVQQKEQKKMLTKEERAKIQKEKNREAAQRSRDMHKEYVLSLEYQVTSLREQLSRSRRYCHRCQQLLDDPHCELLNQQHIPLITEHTDHSIFDESTPSTTLQPQQQYVQPQSFLRTLQPEEENSIFKLMLFVCMVVIAAMVIGANRQPQLTQPRGLVQVYNQLPSEQTNDFSINEKCIEEKGLVELHRGLQQESCLDSLMTVERPALQRSLRSIHDHTIRDKMDSIMLCSVKTPKLYNIAPELTDSPIIRLFVLGSEIKQLASSSEIWRSLVDRNVQLNGIYRLSAQIKSVQLVRQHQCLL